MHLFLMVGEDDSDWRNDGLVNDTENLQPSQPLGPQVNQCALLTTILAVFTGSQTAPCEAAEIQKSEPSNS